MSEVRRLEGQENYDPPTDEELLALLTNSALNKDIKEELFKALPNNQWVKDQLTRIYWVLDRLGNPSDDQLRKTYNDMVKDLWKHLKSDWYLIK